MQSCGLDKAAGTGWEAEGARAAKRDWAAGPYITAATGPGITHGRRDVDYMDIQKGKWTKFNCCLLSTPTGQERADSPTYCDIYLAETACSLDSGSSERPGVGVGHEGRMKWEGDPVYESCHKIELWVRKTGWMGKKVGF